MDQEKTATIAKELVSSINDQLVEIPTQVIRCKLAGIVPVSENVWSEEACDELKGKMAVAYSFGCCIDIIALLIVLTVNSEVKVQEDHTRTSSCTVIISPMVQVCT